MRGARIRDAAEPAMLLAAAGGTLFVLHLHRGAHARARHRMRERRPALLHLLRACYAALVLAAMLTLRQLVLLLFALLRDGWEGGRR